MIGAAQGVNDLVAVSNNAGVDDFGLGLLLNTRQVGGCLCHGFPWLLSYCGGGGGGRGS